MLSDYNSGCVTDHLSAAINQIVIVLLLLNCQSCCYQIIIGLLPVRRHMFADYHWVTIVILYCCCRCCKLCY